MDLAGLDGMVRSYVDRVKLSAPVTPFQHSVAELLQSGRKWPWAWCSRPGIYAFVREDRVVYVGRAARDSLQRRLSDQIRARGDQQWDEVLDDPNTLVVCYPFPIGDWSWVASLELQLIESGAPSSNKRRC